MKEYTLRGKAFFDFYKNDKNFEKMMNGRKIKNFSLIDSAITDLKKSYSLDKNIPQTQRLLGDLYYVNAKYEEAKKYYSNYIQISNIKNRNIKYVYYNLADSKKHINSKNKNYCLDFKKSCDLGYAKSCKIYDQSECKN